MPVWILAKEHGQHVREQEDDERMEKQMLVGTIAMKMRKEC